MPELPEVETVVRELNKKLKNRIIQSVRVQSAKMISIGPNSVSNIRTVKSYEVIKFIKSLQGKRFLSVKRRAKLLIFRLAPSPVLTKVRTPSPSRGEGKNEKAVLFLLVHLKMTGQFIFEDKKLRARTEGRYRLLNKASAPLVSLPSKHTHVIFEFKDSSKLFFNDVRKFGYLKLVKSDQLQQIKELQEYGPEPLNPKFQYPQFLTAFTKRKYGKIKEVLVDPTIVAGIGNIYSDEILFLAGIRPGRKVLSIKYNELRKVYKNIKLVLNQAIKAKGSSVGEYVRTDGSWGEMGKYHWVYGRKGQKCKKCGSIIESLKLGGRTASFCPKCQK